MGFPETNDGLEQQVREKRAFLSETAGVSDEPTARKRGDALWMLGEDLFRLGRFEEAAVRFDEAASTLWKFEDERGTFVDARMRQGLALASLGRDLDALDVLDGLVGEIGIEWSDPKNPDTMALVLGLWLGLLRERGVVDKVDEVADVVLGWDRSQTTLMQRLTLAIALSGKAWVEMLHSRAAEALVFLDELIQLCAEEEGGKYGERFLEHLVSGLVARAYALEQSGQAEAAIAGYEAALVRGAGSRGDPDIDRILDAARTGKMRVDLERADGIRKRLRRRSPQTKGTRRNRGRPS